MSTLALGHHKTVYSPAMESSPSVAPAMSFPALLRNPGLASRYAHLLPPSERPKVRSGKADGSARDREGKRRIRRRENAKFTSNPHVVAPTQKDYSVMPNGPKTTFPQPIPKYLKSPALPTQAAPTFDPASAKAGQFTLTLRGVRKELRRSGPRTEGLVRDVEAALLNWMETGDVVLFEASGVVRDSAPTSTAFSALGPIREIERSAARLVWSINEDAFARYVVHCVCRWHSVVSYSKDDAPSDSSGRLTYILRPNPSRFGGAAAYGPLSSVETPPATVLDTASSRGGHLDSQDSVTDGTGTDPFFSSDYDDEMSDESPGSLTNSIPDLRDSGVLPPITQQTFIQPQTPTRSYRPSRLAASSSSPLAVPTQALQSLTLNEADIEDDADGMDATPRPRVARRVTRNAARMARTTRSRSRSSPSRSPSGIRWRAPLPATTMPASADGVPIALRAPGRPTAQRDVAGAANQQTLWSFIYG